VRVIAGALGGRRLVAPRGRATRPTSDRVREATFSALGDVSDAVVLDLYAGTGALGIEALSRGAQRAVFVDNARAALTALRENIDTLGLAEVTQVLAQSVERAAAEVGKHGPFDLVLLDPPYSACGDIPKVMATLLRTRALAPSARVVVEHASRDAAPACEGFERLSTKTYGDTAISTYVCIP
jgi:16S rRNA (guanine(966)-N(2))-methyltransferase RsmD